MDGRNKKIIIMAIKGITSAVTTSIRAGTETETDTGEITTQEPTTTHQTIANKAMATIAANQMVASR